MGNPVDCAAFRRSIFHFQADEIPEPERRALQEHLDACEDCASRLVFEDAFLSGLKSRLEPVPAPPGLETRIRAALDTERSKRSTRTSPGLRWLRTPWFAATAAALMLALLIVPDLRDSTPSPDRSVLHVERDVTVVDRDCDRAGHSIADQRECRLPQHVNALKLADGTYWNISLDQENYRELTVDPDLRGRRYHVVGDYYPRIRTLQVHRTHDLGRDAL